MSSSISLLFTYTNNHTVASRGRCNFTLKQMNSKQKPYRSVGKLNFSKQNQRRGPMANRPKFSSDWSDEEEIEPSAIQNSSLPKYSYSVELVAMQSSDYSSPEGTVADGAEYARLYEPPSVIFPETSSPAGKKRQNNNHLLQLYGLEERKILGPKEAEHLQLKNCTLKAEGRQKRFQFTRDEQKKFIQKHFEGIAPQFICNLSTLKILITRHIDFKLIATKVVLEDGTSYIYLKYLNFIQESKYLNVGFLVEDVLAVNSIEMNHVLEAVYRATLTDVNGCQEFQIGFIAESDGLWNTAKDKEKFDAKDVIEVKSLGTEKFYRSRAKAKRPYRKRKDLKFSHYFYEEEVLRRYWAHCRLRGIEKLLCAVVHGRKGAEVMKEIWLYNVNKIPDVLKKENKHARPFPKVDFNNMDARDKEKFTELHQTLSWQEWDEETEFCKLYDSLREITSLFDLDEEDDSARLNWATTKYLIFEKDADQLLIQVTKDEFDEW